METLALLIELNKSDHTRQNISSYICHTVYESIADVGETGVWLRADFQSGSRVLKKVF